MLPVSGLPHDIELDAKQQPSKTYRIDFTRGRITGHTDGLDAIRQLVYKVLRTERFAHEIYSPDFGSELSVNEAAEDMERWITEALLQDDRIIEVADFRVVHTKDSALVEFVVVTDYGRITLQEEIGSDV
ncbi:MAG: DUF2634 domain-containing protein [Paenibacillus dendritiformis]|uniref:DUF2634 domain-containing protein n=1 Tax=uncultured Paenibacillus sp. TaxID=227322 RepID=UPI0025E52586|nr:DUF2634 domain-containing protein [uncultured Paenibacillus sp.]MDU5141055.1 DUF2634 domain-containing protein [Paenibacillus dendritiformis]